MNEGDFARLEACQAEVTALAAEAGQLEGEDLAARRAAATARSADREASLTVEVNRPRRLLPGSHPFEKSGVTLATRVRYPAEAGRLHDDRVDGVALFLGEWRQARLGERVTLICPPEEPGELPRVRCLSVEVRGAPARVDALVAKLDLGALKSLLKPPVVNSPTKVDPTLAAIPTATSAAKPLGERDPDRTVVRGERGERGAAADLRRKRRLERIVEELEMLREEAREVCGEGKGARLGVRIGRQAEALRDLAADLGR
jgi:hypothetical protein